MAIGTLLVHVLGLVLWVGGLLAIILSTNINREVALKRFSQLAFWAAISVVISGVVNAWLRMNFAGAWHGSYAILLAEKIILTLILIFMAEIARKNISADIKKLITVE